ncbi:MAG: aryl-sulfate sulfotransferase [Bacteroidota bacterium]
MTVRYLFICLSTLISFTAISNVLPKNGQMLNFTEVMFEHPAVNGAITYRVTIVKKVSGKFNADPVIIRVVDSTPATRISKGLLFGHAYMWRYEALNKLNKPLFTSGIFNFTILNSKLLDSNLCRIKVVKECKEECTPGIVFIDGLSLAVNKQGIPKWVVPDIPEGNKLLNYRDLHLTRSGTLLFIDNSGALETDLFGNILWRTPVTEKTTDKEEKYHHAFHKDDRSNYMICGRKNIADPDTKINGQMLFEYDSSGKEIWRFDACEAIKQKFGVYPSDDTAKVYTLGHLNGFAIDQTNGLIYASFRDFNSIFQVDKTSGQILAAWGNRHISYEEKNDFDDHLFAAQHAPVLLKNGNIMIFNNNVPERSSSIIELAPDPSNGNCTKIWEYVLEEHVNESPYGGKTNSAKMGIATELPDGNILVGMGQLNRIFEVTKNKFLAWEIYPETRRDSLLPWTEAPSYRVSYSSSLYPSYFTIEHRNASSQLKAGQNISLRINNEGSENDRYTIALLSDDKHIEQRNMVTDITGETSAYLELKVVPLHALAVPVKIKVILQKAGNWYLTCCLTKFISICCRTVLTKNVKYSYFPQMSLINAEVHQPAQRKSQESAGRYYQ